jgi:general secretion pathway protein J
VNGIREPLWCHRGGRGRVPHQGFTLIEVMVALTILSLIMLATITGLRTLAKTQSTLERMTARVDEVRTVSGFLRDTLGSAVVGSNKSRLSLGGAPSEKTFFQASSDALAWKSTILFGESFGGAYLVRVAREGDSLVLRWQEPVRPGSIQDWGQAPSRLLVQNLDSFKVTFRPAYTSAWVDTIPRDTVPALVRLQIQSSGRHWPDLIATVQSSR